MAGRSTGRNAAALASIATALAMLLLLALPGAASATSTALPLTAPLAHAAAGPPDCDNDADPGTDPNEYAECYPPPATFCPVATAPRDAPAGPGPCQRQTALTPQQKAELLRNADRAMAKALVACAAALPSGPLAEAFLAICAYHAIEQAAALAELTFFDPPDQNFAQVALPRALLLPHALASCRGLRVSGAACRRLRGAFGRFASASAYTAALHEAITIALNRFTTAKAAGNIAGAALQDAVVKTYSGGLAAALFSDDAAGRAVASALRAGHVRVRLSAAQVRREKARLARLQGLPPFLVPRLLGDGFDLSQLKLAMRIGDGRVRAGAQDLRALLTARSSTGSLIRDFQSMTFSDVASIVAALTAQGVVSLDVNFALNNDLQAAQLACDPNQRAAAVRQFVRDADTRVAGAFSLLLHNAALPLLTVRPTRADLPPSASFTAAPVTGSVSGGTNTITLTDTSTDAADGGKVVCHTWDFGDPTSGASNTRTDLVVGGLSVTHTYAASGTYTITLTVSDDDGFARATTTRQVTITP
jgi:hypothetical protein